MKTHILFLSATFFLSAPLAQKAEKSFVIQNVRLFDGTKTTAETDVFIQGGKISFVGKSPELEKTAGEKIDGKGKTLLPGLIDAHTHVQSKEDLSQALEFGVTTELDMFTTAELMAEVKKEQAANPSAAFAALYSAGILVTSPGGHGTEYGIKIPTIEKPEEAQAFVDARLAEGSDYIKIVYDDGSSYGLSMSTISKETLKAVVAAAHQRKKLAVCHIGSQQGAQDAIESGVDGLVHIFANVPPEPSFVTLAASKKAFVIPTLSVNESACGVASGKSLLSDAHLKPFLPPVVSTNLTSSFPFAGKMKFENAKEAVMQLKKAGVPILAGTDCPNPGTAHGVSLHRELELLVQAGLTPEEALAAATSTPALKFSLQDRGTIAVGKRADLLLVNGDPTKDILATRDIVTVWKAGVAVDREAFRKSVAAMQSETANAKEASGPKNLGDGLISDFEGEKVAAKFGFGWQSSTDKIMGGKSTAEISIAPEGVNQSKGCLQITGEIVKGAANPWAGATFYPGSAPMAAANLSAKKNLSFWAKGDGKMTMLLIFTKTRGYQPSFKMFAVSNEWKQYHFAWSDFDGSDGSDVMGIFFGCAAVPGKFSLLIDDVKLD